MIPLAEWTANKVEEWCGLKTGFEGWTDRAVAGFARWLDAERVKAVRDGTLDPTDLGMVEVQVSITGSINPPDAVLPRMFTIGGPS